MSKSQIPIVIHVHKLDRTGRWCLNRVNTEGKPSEEYDAFIATEAILNISQDVGALRIHASETDSLVCTTLSQVASLMPKSASLLMLFF